MTTRNFRVNNGLEVGDIVLNASTNKITGLATAAPSADGDVSNKKYVDDKVNLTILNTSVVVSDTGSNGAITNTADAGVVLSQTAAATTITASGAINLTAGTDVVVPANVGVTFGTGEKIEGDNTDLTVTSGGKINLTAATDVHIPNAVGLVFGDGGEHIETNNTDFTITSGGKINLATASDVHMANDKGIVFGDAGEKIEGDGTDLTITSSGLLNLSAGTDVVIPINIGLHFTDANEKIESNGTNLTITAASGVIALAPSTDVTLPNDKGLIFGDAGEKIEGDGTDLTISSSAALNLTAGTDVVIPANIGLTFGSGEKIEGDNTDLTITSGGKINLATASDVHMANDRGIVFGDAGEKIEGDGTNLTISSSGLCTITATGNTAVTNNLTVGGNTTITGNLVVNGDTTTVSTTNTTIADNIIELNTGISASSNDAGIIIERGSTGNNAAILWDESADKFTMGTTTATAADKSGGVTVSVSTLVANLEGTVTGDVTGNADTATVGTTVTVSDNESTNENNVILFAAGAAGSGNLGVEADGNMTYNPSTGKITATGFIGALTGTASLATNVTAADESSDTSCNVLFVTAATGDLPPKTGTNLTFNSSSGVLTATGFAGALTGDVTGNADTATVATTVTITDNESTNENNPLVFVAGGDLDGGNLGLESDGTATYNPSTGKITATGFVGALTGNASGSSGSCTGLAATATALANARTIGGVSFNGTAAINLPGVNTAGNQNTSGTAAVATAVTAADESSDTSCNVLFVTAATGDLPPKTGTNLTFNSSSGVLTATGFAGALTGDVTGNADTATVATTVTITDNESTNENNPLVFVAGGDLDGGNLGLESDGTATYNPSTGKITATGFIGSLTGTASAAQYSDVAERFASDSNYEEGTVVTLGGAEEITITTEEASDDVFGVVSSVEQAAFKMNSDAGSDSTHPYIAMTGRVWVKITGVVNKGDRLISSATPGHARAATKAECTAFNVLGRALEFSDTGRVKAAVRVSH